MGVLNAPFSPIFRRWRVGGAAFITDFSKIHLIQRLAVDVLPLRLAEFHGVSGNVNVCVHSPFGGSGEYSGDLRIHAAKMFPYRLPGKQRGTTPLSRHRHLAHVAFKDETRGKGLGGKGRLRVDVVAMSERPAEEAQTGFAGGEFDDGTEQCDRAAFALEHDEDARWT